MTYRTIPCASACSSAVSTAFRRRSSSAVNKLGRAARHHRGDGEVGRHEDGRAGAVPRHRRSHLARGGVLPRRAEARGAAGHLRHQQPVLVDGRRQVLQLLGDGRSLACAIPKTVLLPQKAYPADIDLTPESLRNLGYPIDWDGAARLRRPAGDPEAVLGRRLEARLQGERQAGAARAYDGTAPYCMTLQEFIDFDQYVRCFTFGKTDITPVGLRSARAPLSRRSRLPVARSSARGSSATRRRSTRRSATR